MIGKVWKKQGGASGGNVVNGIIEQYKASTSTIDANTFVEFVNGTLTIGTDTTLVNAKATYDNPLWAKAIFIDDNKVAIYYQNNSDTRYYITICTINNTTITVGTPNQVESDTNSTIVTLDTNKLMLIRPYGTSNLAGIVYTVSGTTITAGELTTIASSTNASYYPKAIQLDTNKVLILHRGDSTYLKAIVCTISGTTIIAGTDTTLSTDSRASQFNDVVAINSSSFFVANCYTSNKYLYGVAGTISGSTITIGSSLSLSSTSYSGNNMKCVNIGNNKVLVLHTRNNSNYMNGIVCTISNNGFEKGTDTSLLNNQHTASIYGIDAINYGDNKEEVLEAPFGDILISLSEELDGDDSNVLVVAMVNKVDDEGFMFRIECERLKKNKRGFLSRLFKR